jgi:hypothetical protein
MRGYVLSVDVDHVCFPLDRGWIVANVADDWSLLEVGLSGVDYAASVLDRGYEWFLDRGSRLLDFGLFFVAVSVVCVANVGLSTAYACILGYKASA